MLRKWTHIDHYRTIDPFWSAEDLHLREHTGKAIPSPPPLVQHQFPHEKPQLPPIHHQTKTHSLTTSHWQHHHRKPTDHCIDILRQVLMCNSDTGLVVFHWVQGIGAPTPDFSTAVNAFPLLSPISLFSLLFPCTNPFSWQSQTCALRYWPRTSINVATQSWFCSGRRIMRRRLRIIFGRREGRWNCRKGCEISK